jgi:hypothetical protein
MIDGLATEETLVSLRNKKNAAKMILEKEYKMHKHQTDVLYKSKTKHYGN